MSAIAQGAHIFPFLSSDNFTATSPSGRSVNSSSDSISVSMLLSKSKQGSQYRAVPADTAGIYHTDQCIDTGIPLVSYRKKYWSYQPLTSRTSEFRLFRPVNTILSFFGFTITRELVSKTKLIPKRTLKLKNPKICELTQLRIAWSKPGSGQRCRKNLFRAATWKWFLYGFREWPKAAQKAFSL